MDMAGERRIPAPRETVWAALNDPAILKTSIPGCDSLESTGENAFKATASVKIGPISAKFAGKVQLADIDPPNGYTISGEGQGGVAGFAKGGAKVALEEAEANSTLLKYTVQAQVGGKIAQLGARLIDASAKQMADQFFDRFSARLTPPVIESDAPVETADGHPPPELLPRPTPPAPSLLSLESMQPFGIPLLYWAPVALFVVILLLLFGAYL
jgi:carbon monoxide dehydrogenase subunit G